MLLRQLSPRTSETPEHATEVTLPDPYYLKQPLLTGQKLRSPLQPTRASLRRQRCSGRGAWRGLGCVRVTPDYEGGISGWGQVGHLGFGAAELMGLLLTEES